MKISFRWFVAGLLWGTFSPVFAAEDIHDQLSEALHRKIAEMDEIQLPSAQEQLVELQRLLNEGKITRGQFDILSNRISGEPTEAVVMAPKIVENQEPEVVEVVETNIPVEESVTVSTETTEVVETNIPVEESTAVSTETTDVVEIMDEEALRAALRTAYSEIEPEEVPEVQEEVKEPAEESVAEKVEHHQASEETQETEHVEESDSGEIAHEENQHHAETQEHEEKPSVYASGSHAAMDKSTESALRDALRKSSMAVSTPETVDVVATQEDAAEPEVEEVDTEKLRVELNKAIAATEATASEEVQPEGVVEAKPEAKEATPEIAKPVDAHSRVQMLKDLLERYKADEIDPFEYQKERKRILNLP